jgi:hypothetical protein
LAYSLFDWYHPVFYLTQDIEYPYERNCIGQWLGIAEECNDEMAFTVIAVKGKVLVQKYVWAISEEELAQ